MNSDHIFKKQANVWEVRQQSLIYSCDVRVQLGRLGHLRLGRPSRQRRLPAKTNTEFVAVPSRSHVKMVSLNAAQAHAGIVEPAHARLLSLVCWKATSAQWCAAVLGTSLYVSCSLCATIKHTYSGPNTTALPWHVNLCTMLCSKPVPSVPLLTPLCTAGGLTQANVQGSTQMFPHMPAGRTSRGDPDIEWRESDNHVYMTGTCDGLCWTARFQCRMLNVPTPCPPSFPVLASFSVTLCNLGPEPFIHFSECL
jgi:hypothetical protein